MLKLDLQFFAPELVCIYVKDNSGNELFSTEAMTASFEITVTETGLTCSTTGESVIFIIDNFAGFSLTKGATEAEYTIGNTYTIYGMPGPEEGTNVLYIVEGGDVMPTIKGVWRFTTSTLNGITDKTWATTELAVNVSIQGYDYNDVTHLRFNKSYASSSSIDSIYPGNGTSQYSAIYNDYYDEPWMAESYKTWDFGETEQTVPDWFYTLVTSKAVQLYKIKGKWVFNDTISFPETLHQTVKFTSNSVGWNDMAKSLSSDDLGYFYDYDDEMALYNWVYKNGTWNDNSYQTVDFGSTEQTVSDAFYTWCTANATQQVETPTYKFTKLENVGISYSPTVVYGIWTFGATIPNIAQTLQKPFYFKTGEDTWQEAWRMYGQKNGSTGAETLYFQYYDASGNNVTLVVASGNDGTVTFKNEYYRFIDFGALPVNVSDSYYTWLETAATPTKTPTNKNYKFTRFRGVGAKLGTPTGLYFDGWVNYLRWQSVESAEKYNIYLVENGVYTLHGTVEHDSEVREQGYNIGWDKYCAVTALSSKWPESDYSEVILTNDPTAPQ